MFEANLVGKLKRVIGRDVHARAQFAPAIDCPFGPVNLEVKSEKTIVRADSSASRGSADERTSKYAQILISPIVPVAIGDRFEFDGMAFLITSVHTRRSVFGNIDHFDCFMEPLPNEITT